MFPVSLLAAGRSDIRARSWDIGTHGPRLDPVDRTLAGPVSIRGHRHSKLTSRSGCADIHPPRLDPKRRTLIHLISITVCGNFDCISISLSEQSSTTSRSRTTDASTGTARSPLPQSSEGTAQSECSHTPDFRFVRRACNNQLPRLDQA